MQGIIPIFPFSPSTPPAGPEPWAGIVTPRGNPTKPVVTVNGVAPDANGNVTVDRLVPIGGTAGKVLSTSSSGAVAWDYVKWQYIAGNPTDNQLLSVELGAKISKVSGAGVGNLASFDIGGSVSDSGKKVSDFANASHSHVQSDVTGLSAALAGKAPLSHYHAMSNVTGLASALSGKAASSHSHVMDDVTGLSDALAGKITDPGGTKTSGYVLTVDGTSLAWMPTGSGADGNAVHYTADVGKNDAQKAQARTNIGAASSDDVDQKRGKLDLAVYGPSYDFSPVARSFDGGNSFSYSIVDDVGTTVYLKAFNLSYGPQLVATLNTLGSLQPPIVPGDEYTRYEIATVTEDGLNLGIPVSLVGTILRMTATAPTSDSLAKVSQVPTSAQTASWTAKQNKISVGNGKLVKCTGNGTVAAAEASDVPGLSGKQDSLAWASGKSYSAGNVVLKDGILYTCKTANSDTTWTPSKWESKCLPVSGGTLSGNLGFSSSGFGITLKGLNGSSVSITESGTFGQNLCFNYNDGTRTYQAYLPLGFGWIPAKRDTLPAASYNWYSTTHYNTNEICWYDDCLWIAMQESTGQEPDSGSMYWAQVTGPTSFAVMTYGQSFIDSPTSDVFISFENDLLKMRDAPDGTTGVYNQLSMSIPNGNQAYFQAYYKGASSVKYARLDRTGVHTSSSAAGASTETEVTYGPDGVKVETYSVSGGVRAASPTEATTAFAVTHDGVELESVVLKDTGPGRSGHKYRLSVYNGELTIAEI